VIVAAPVAETRKRTAVAGVPATLLGASRCGPEETTDKLSRTVFSPTRASRVALSSVASGSAATSKRIVVWPGSASNVSGTLRRLELLVREIAAVSEVPEGESRSSHTPLIPDLMRLVQESDTRFVMAVKLLAGTENVKVWLTLPDVAMRITHPARALVVVNCTLPVVAPVAIVSEAGIVNAELDDSSLATVGEAAGVPSETTQLPEIPGVRTVGMQDSDNGLVSVGATREMAAVNLAVPRAAVMAALCEVVIVAVDAVKVAETALAGTVKVPGTVNRDGRLLERETATPPTGAALERVTVQVVLAAEAKLAAAH
jgi:hypothetical protein